MTGNIKELFYYKMAYKNPGSTTDIIIENEGNILLIKRNSWPFKNKWALPGGFLDCGKESLEEAAARELMEETSLSTKVKDLAFFRTYSNPHRDPRGHVISHVYIARRVEGIPKAGDDAGDVRFFPLNNLPELAFDHRDIITDYIKNRYREV